MFFTQSREERGAGASSSPHMGSEEEAGPTSRGGAERRAIANAQSRRRVFRRRLTFFSSRHFFSLFSSLRCGK
jgi:hypothetical protein